MAVADHKRFLVWLILAVGAWWPTLHALLGTAMRDENYSYTLLVLGVSVALLCFERWDHPTKQAWPLSEICLAVPVLAAAAWLNFRTTFVAGDSALTLSIFLWIAFILAIFANVYGWQSFSRVRFPLLFSLLAVPLPERAISALITALQWGSADAANLLFRLFRVPVARDGLVFSFTQIEIEVARECSSIRSSTILVVTSLVIAQLFLKSDSSKWIAFLISLPVALFKNGLRIFILSLLGEYVSVSWLDSSFHHQGGFIFLAVGLGMMLVVIWLLGRAEGRRLRQGKSG